MVNFVSAAKTVCARTDKENKIIRIRTNVTISLLLTKGNTLAVNNAKWQENPSLHWGKAGLNHHKRILTTTQENSIEREQARYTVYSFKLRFFINWIIGCP
jgi:hypothetical protein